MATKEILEKASDKVGGGETGASYAADPAATGSAKRPIDKDNGEPMPSASELEKQTPQAGDASADSNKSTVAAKPSAASAKMEDVEAMFSGEDLSEEFKEKAFVIFEAAVASKIAEERTKLQEEFEQKVEEITEQINNELVEKIDDYLNYVVKEWMEENEVAVESSLRNEVTQDFIYGLKSLFKENYIEVPEDKVDVLEALSTRVQELETELNSSMNESLELKKQIDGLTQEKVFASVAEELTVTQQEKFATLAEGVTFDDPENYEKKLRIVKDNYFAEKKAASVSSLEEEVEEQPAQVKSMNEQVSNYVKAISRTVKV